MRRRIWSKILAVVLSAAMCLPGLSGSVVAVAAQDAGTTVINADFSSAHSNWGAIKGTGNDVATFDGKMHIGEKLAGNAFYTLTNWPDLPLKKVTIDIGSMLLDTDNSSRIRLLYRYNGAEDYEGVQLRNNGSKNWHLLFTEAKGSDAVNGQSNDARQDTVGNGKYNTNTGKLSGMETGTIIILDYSEAGYCSITFQNKQDASQNFTIKIKAVGKEFNADGMQFALGVETGYNGASHYANINSVSFEFDGVIAGAGEAQKEADQFKTAHAAILSKTVETVTVSDRVAVDTALAIYGALSNEAKALLTAEKALLDALKAKISELSMATGGYFEDDFESGSLANWVALKDEAEGWGIVDNPDAKGNTSSKVFRPLANTEKPGDKNPWQEGYLFNQKHYPVYTLTDEIWTAQTAGGQKLASVSGDLYCNAADWNTGVMFIYWYQDADNYKAIYIRKENVPDTQNDRTDAKYDYAVRKVVKSGNSEDYQATAIKPGSSYSTVPAKQTGSEWTHFVFDYAEDGSECKFTLMDAQGNAETYTLDQKAGGSGKTEAQVKLNEGKFALSTMAWALTNYHSYIDNISFNFTGSAKDAAECFKAEYARTIYMDINTIIPDDKATIAAAIAAYNKLSNEAKAFLAVEQGKLQALAEAANKWTGNTAASFRQIHANALQAGASRAELEAAWNVLRRLPSATQNTLAADKETLVAALKAMEGTGTKKPIEIACIGDSLTWGSGSADVKNDSWPKQLGELLGTDYLVRNYGVAGIQAAHIYNNEISRMGQPYGNNLQLENTRTDGWMNSHINQADVVIIMLGTNDAGKVCGDNILKDPELAAKEKQCYMDAMKALIASYQALPSSPTIVLATSPVRMLPTDGDAKKTSAYYAQERMYEVQKELIAELGLPSIDIYALTKAWEAEGTTADYFNEDCLHFVRAGYTKIAEAVKEYVSETIQIGFQTDNGGLTYVYFVEKPVEYDVSEYRANGTYTYPEKDGAVFAGWYTDPDYTIPLGENVTEGKAYAKFVDSEVLSVKLQVTLGTTAESENTNLRLVTTVDNTMYRNVGFSVIFDNKSMGGDRVSTKVYRQITAWNEGKEIKYSPKLFSDESEYFMTYRFTNIPKAAFEKEFKVTPVWTTLDGTRVTGSIKTFCISDSWTAQAVQGE